MEVAAQRWSAADRRDPSGAEKYVRVPLTKKSSLLDFFPPVLFRHFLPISVIGLSKTAKFSVAGPILIP